MTVDDKPTVKEYKILTLSHRYNAFIKETVEATSRYVNQINVLVPHNKLAEFSNYMPLGGYFEYVKRFTKINLLNLNGKPNNVNVRLIPLTYFIPDGSNKKLGDKLANKFEELIRKEKIEFDLIHAHFTWPCGYAATKLGKRFNVPTIITLHENRDWLIKEYNSKNRRIHWTWENADALIRVNKRDTLLLKEFNNEIYSIPNGYNPEKFYFIEQTKARKILGLSLENKIIFSLAYLSKRKGFQFLIESIFKIRDKQRDILCLIGGKGPYKAELEDKISELGLQKNVRLLGFIPDSQINLWFNAADIFVLPSLSEGNPTVMFEALGVGLPFVGTKVGGVPEIITSEDYGLLVEPANPQDLAEKILIALDKSWDNKKIKKYAEQFTWENIAKETVEIYENAIRNKNQ